MIVNHDDGEREYEYAVEAVNHLAAENSWRVISIKKIGNAFLTFQKTNQILIRKKILP